MDEFVLNLNQLAPAINLQTQQWDVTSLFALAAGLGWAGGLRLYALVFVVGALGRWGGIVLPGNLDVLTSPWMLSVSGVLLVIEFFADKIPWLDSLWDSVHTFIRIPGGAVLAAAALGGQPEEVQVMAALLGGSLAAGTHLAKAGTRAVLNTSPEPVTNVGASLTEDALFGGGLWLLWAHPVWFIAVLVVFMVFVLWLLVVLWRLIRQRFRINKTSVSQLPAADSG